MSSTSLSSLPSEVIEEILNHLGHDDLLNLRLACLKANAPKHDDLKDATTSLLSLYNLLRAMSHQEHIKYLNRLETSSILEMDLQTVRISPASGKLLLHCRLEKWPPPREAIATFCRMRSKVNLINLDRRIVRSLLTFMPALQELTVILESKIGTVPNLQGIDQLTQLRHLNIHFANNEKLRRFPKALLKLKMLRSLQLINFRRLRTLPDDMGDQLPQLCFFKLTVNKLNVIPTSLMTTLERNCNQISINHGIWLGNACSNVPIWDLKHWQRMLTAEQFPILAQYIHELNGPHFSLK